MMRVRQSNPRGRGSRKKRGVRVEQDLNQAVISHPPQIPSYEIRHGVRLRFVSNASFTSSISFQNLLDTIVMAATAIAGFDLFVAVKVRRIQLWATPVVGGATSVSVQFAGGVAGIVGDQKLHTDTSMGVQPAHVSAKPAMRSTLSSYQVSSVNEAFVIIGPSGTVVDVELSFVGAFNQPVAAQNALVGATAGAVYLRGLDGLAIATTKFTPVYTAGTI